MSDFVSRGGWKIFVWSPCLYTRWFWPAAWIYNMSTLGLKFCWDLSVQKKRERIEDFNYIMCSHWVRALTHVSGETLKTLREATCIWWLLPALLCSYTLTPVVYKTFDRWLACAFSRLFDGFTEIKQSYLFFTRKPSGLRNGARGYAERSAAGA